MSKKKVLIADDSLISRKKIRKYLESIELVCDEAINGFDAISKINENHYDLLILDLLMPDYDGFYTLETLQNNKNIIPIIVISADIQETSRAKVFALGASEFINKPPKEDELKSAIALLVDKFEIINV